MRFGAAPKAPPAFIRDLCGDDERPNLWRGDDFLPARKDSGTGGWVSCRPRYLVFRTPWFLEVELHYYAKRGFADLSRFLQPAETEKGQTPVENRNGVRYDRRR